MFAGAILLFAAMPVFAQSAPLPPERAFRLSARAIDPTLLEVRFNIADGYYLYRDKMRFTMDPASVELTVPALPAGKFKEDQFFGRTETYRGIFVVYLQLKSTAPGQRVVLQAESQGCADLGICYPPNLQRVSIALPAAGGGPTRFEEPPRKQWFR